MMTDVASVYTGAAALTVLGVAYILVIAEELTELRKSIPVVIAGGLIWILIAADRRVHGIAGVLQALEPVLLEYAQLLLFLLSAMTFVSALEERRVFERVRAALLRRKLSLRATFWVTGLLAFLLSPFIDNLTTALILGAVVIAIGRGMPRFLAPACVNLVVAANAGGAFSPFGDITTLMVWQKGVLGFFDFFALFLPALVNWIVPAACMHFAVPRDMPQRAGDIPSGLRPGGRTLIVLFAATIAVTVWLRQVFGLPPFLGMTCGLGGLQLAGYLIRRRDLRDARRGRLEGPAGQERGAPEPFDVFQCMRRVEWDTLLFFYGVMLCVGGLGALGYLEKLSGVSYIALGATGANVLVGFASAIIDNIPIMFAVLKIDPGMSPWQWQLVTLTAGVGGSLLSIGSAAGVALMGQARGSYTFMAHFKWTWAIALGYGASILTHYLVSGPAG